MSAGLLCRWTKSLYDDDDDDDDDDELEQVYKRIGLRKIYKLFIVDLSHFIFDVS